MHKVLTSFAVTLIAVSIAGCGDVTVNTPSRPRIIVEEKKEPVIIEKTVVEKPVIIEKKTVVEKPVIVIEKH